MSQHGGIAIVGRSSSHFTRATRIVAHALEVPYELEVVPDLLELAPEGYGMNPALKIPSLRVGGALLFGTENICRRLAELAPEPARARVVWPEELKGDLARNAQELIWFSMGAQVDLVLGKSSRGVANPVLAKRAAGLKGALGWLDRNLDEVLDELPKERDLSLLEVTLFCLVEHLVFRPTIDLDHSPNLRRFAEGFGARPFAKETAYRFDLPRQQAAQKPLEKPALDPATLTPRTSSSYPPEYRERVLPREKRALGDALGLTQFGVNLTTLFPGKESSMRHFHSHEDELVYVLEGEVFLRTDAGEQRLTAGMCAGFPAGSEDGHQLVNRSTVPAQYLEIGSRDPADTIGYPDVDLAATKDERGVWVFGRRSVSE